MDDEDFINIGLTKETHEILQLLKDNAVFNEMQDAYRFGIAFAIVQGLVASENLSFKTSFHVASIDRDGSLRNLITEVYPEAADRPYAMAQRLAEAGLERMGYLYKNGQLRFGEIYKSVLEGTQQLRQS